MDSDRLATRAYERARLAAPMITLGIAAAALVSEPSGIPMTAPVLVMNAITCAIGVALTLYMRVRRTTAARHGHALAAAVWMLGPINTVVALASVKASGLGAPMLLEVLIAAVIQVDTRWYLATTVPTTATWLALDLAHRGTLSLPGRAVIAGLVTSVIIHVLTRRLLLRAETATAELAHALERLRDELAERQRSELEKESLREQVVHAQRLEAVGSLAAGLAHDMNNILTGVIGMGVGIRDGHSTHLVADADALVKEAERGAHLTRSLLAFGRRGQYQRKPEAASSIVADVKLLLGRTLPKQVSIATEGNANFLIDVDRPQITQALVNLCLNAATAMSDAGTVTIAASMVETPTGKRGTISVRDTGRGIPAALRGQIFEPFYTTKPAGSGSGLGLAMVWGTVHGHDGTIEVDSEIDHGSTFRIALPIVAGELPPVVVEAAAPRRGRVLVIDDEPLVRTTTTRLLARAGLQVVTAGDGAEGLEVFRAHADDIQLVVLDMSMPVMSGPECFRGLRALRPGLPIVIVSGYAIEAETRALLALGDCCFLEKPYRREQLVEAVAQFVVVKA